MVFPFLAESRRHWSLSGVEANSQMSLSSWPDVLFHFAHFAHFARFAHFHFGHFAPRLAFAYSQTQARPMSNYE